MNKKHLFWVVPISLIIGIIIGNEIYVCHRDTAPDNIHIENRWDCEEGCLYAEWITYGYKKLSKPSELYNRCSEVCWIGDNYFK